MRGEHVLSVMPLLLSKRWAPSLLLFMLLLASWLTGCGAGGASKEAAAPMAPSGTAMDAAADGDYAEQAAPESEAFDDGGADEGGGNAMAAPAPAAPPPARAGAPDAAPAKATDAPGQASAVSKAGADQPLLIYRATLTMAVFETKKAMDEVEKLAKAAGGYLVQRNDMQITVRVPARRFDNALDEFAKHGDELHREVQVSDVTDQFNDLAIRLRNAEAMRDRLAALLLKANNVEEALAVEAQLERVAGSIELIKGKLKRLRELIAFSTITVRFEARPVDKVKSKVELPFFWLKQLGLPELLEL